MTYKRRKKTEAFCFHTTVILSALQAFWVLYLPVSIALRLNFAVFYKYKYKNKRYSKGIWLQYEQSVDICTDVVRTGRTPQEPFMLKLASFLTYCKLRRRLRKVTRITWFFSTIAMDQFKAMHRHWRKLRHEISNMAKFESNLSRTDGKRATWRNFANVHTREGEVCVPYLNKCWFELWSFPTFQSYIVVSSQHIVLKFGNFYSFYVTSPYSVERFSLTDHVKGW